MNEKEKIGQRPSREQVIYANMLVLGVWTGIAILFTTYFLYLSGIITPHVDISLIPQLWGKGVNEYLELTHSPHGWDWVSLVTKGDFLNYVGLVLLAMMTVICYMVLLKGYLVKKDWIYASIAFLEILVLLVAASGLLGSGGH
jgi:hypothetical protein